MFPSGTYTTQIVLRRISEFLTSERIDLLELKMPNGNRLRVGQVNFVEL